MAQDIIGKDILQEEIRTGHQKYEIDTIISSIAAGIIIFDNFGNIVRMNKIAESVLGYSVDDFNVPYHIRFRNLKLIKADGKPYIYEESPLYRALRGETIRNEEMIINRQPDKEFWVSSTLSPILDANNNPLGVVFVIEDITKRKHIEEVLRKSEKQYRTLAENTPNIIARFDKELRHIYINEYGAKVYGKPKEEIIGRTYADLRLPGDKAYFRQYFEEVFATGKLKTVEFDYDTSFGHRHFSSLFVPESDEAGEIISVLVVTRENTEHKRAHLERVEAIEWLQALVQVTEIAASQLEPSEATQRALEFLAAHHGIDLTIVWLAAGDCLELVASTNYPKAFLENSPMPLSAPFDAPRVYYTGVPVIVPDTVNGNPAVCYLHERMGIELRAYAILPLRSRGQVIGTLNFGWNKPRPISPSEVDYYTSIGNGLGVIFENVRLYEAEKNRTRELGELRKNLERIVEDKTQELQAVNFLLRQSEQQYREIIEVSPDAYFILADNKIVYANPAAVQLFGTDKTQGIDSNFLRKFTTPEKFNEIKQLLTRCGQCQQLIQLGELTFQKETDLPSVTVEVTVVPVIFEGKKAYQFIVRDITRRKAMEKEMARLDRLNIVGEMAAAIGHEVRNPMTSVRGFLQLMENKEADPVKLEYYGIMIDELDRANSIITEFLSLAKDRSVKLMPVSLNSIINSLYPLLSASATKQDKYIVLKKGDIPTNFLNEKDVRQLIINLATNGLEAMPAGGCVTIGTYDGQDEVVLFVEDQGTGIKPEVYDKLGTPFVTTKEKGTGLGLSVCYSIADKHKAKIDVTTGTEGTTFFVRFNKKKQPKDNYM